MKNILVITAFALISQFIIAQDNETDRVRFGLKITPSVNWYKPAGKLISGNGAALRFGGGLIIEKPLSKVASFQTGLQIDIDGGTVKYENHNIYPSGGGSTVSYFYNKVDDELVEYDADKYSSDPAYIHYQLNERKYKVTYLTVPLSLKLKTKEIGMMTYFGQVGINSSFRWKAEANDNLTAMNSSGVLGEKENKSKIDITKDVNIINETATFGLGTEMNFSGTTSLLIGLNYNLGFTSATKNKSDYLNLTKGGGIAGVSNEDMPQVLKSNAVVLTIGVLF